MGMEKLLVQPFNENFDAILSFAKDNGLGVEIASFAFPDLLDSGWEQRVEEYKKKLKGFKGRVSFHGVFKDLAINSQDSKVRALAEGRLLHCVQIAESLGAEFAVFHTNYNPLIHNEGYRRGWVKAHTSFWKKVTAEHSPVILLENLWEPEPSLMKEVADAVGPKVRLCIDVAHINIFSKIPAHQWFSELGDRVAYIHVNDNKGDTDNELIPGEGTIDWQAFTKDVRKHCGEPLVVLEVAGIDKTKASYEYFKKNKVYPLDRR
jgi:sugar phosphate isomerase/epimerase